MTAANLPSPERAARPDYGLDAPGVVRNLALAGAACFLVGVAAGFSPWPGGDVGAWLLFIFFMGGLSCATTCGLMLWTSKVGKVRGRERLLNQIPWKGDEQVLDVGCGRGLLLVGAARRLTAGKATGIDLWQAEDLTGNSAEAALENARREGVADRVEVKTADMRQLPFPDASFDVVMSCAAVHNLYNRWHRMQAIDEIARVLKPGGLALLDDIRHTDEYARRLADLGWGDARRLRSVWWSLVLRLLTPLRPAALLAQKPLPWPRPTG
jgi:SAM-dependent methyltransferase